MSLDAFFPALLLIVTRVIHFLAKFGSENRKSQFIRGFNLRGALLAHRGD